MSDEIVCKNLQKKIKGKPILKGINLRAAQGRVVALLGPNGAGKTTTFSILCGLLKPDEGKVFLNDSDITELPMYKRARLGIGYLPQESSIFRGLTVEENIFAILDLNNVAKKDSSTVIKKLLDDLSLSHIRKSPAISISGGERRKLEIARSLASNPKFILLDEPFAGIDPLAIEEMKEMIKILKARGIGVIITDHNVRDTLPIVDYAYLLFDGQVLVEGTPKDIIENEEAKKLYLGSLFLNYI